jgi:hypothetical protein
MIIGVSAKRGEISEISELKKKLQGHARLSKTWKRKPRNNLLYSLAKTTEMLRFIMQRRVYMY